MYVHPCNARGQQELCVLIRPSFIMFAHSSVINSHMYQGLTRGQALC